MVDYCCLSGMDLMPYLRFSAAKLCSDDDTAIIT